MYVNAAGMKLVIKMKTFDVIFARNELILKILVELMKELKKDNKMLWLCKNYNTQVMMNLKETKEIR